MKTNFAPFSAPLPPGFSGAGPRSSVRHLSWLITAALALVGSSAVLAQAQNPTMPIKKYQPQFQPYKLFDAGDDACRYARKQQGLPQTCASSSSITYNEPINFFVHPMFGQGCNVRLDYWNLGCAAPSETYNPSFRQNWVLATYVCPPGMSLNAGFCYGPQTPPSCPLSNNPVNKAEGWKYWTEADFSGSIEFRRSYTSRPDAGSALSSGLGKHWRHSFDRSIQFTADANQVYVVREDGAFVYFSRANSAAPWTQSSGSTLKLSSNGTGYTLLTAGNSTEEYNALGQLGSITTLNGKKMQFTYTVGTGMLLTATDVTTGRSLSFSPSATDPYTIASITDSAGLTVSYQQTAAGELNSVTYGSGAQNLRQFHYEDAINPSLLTGITDERGQRVTTYGYDGSARVLSTKSWAAPGVATNQHGYAYPNASTVAITNPLGLTVSVTHALIANVDRITATTQPCPSCGTSAKTASYDSNGFVDLQTDFNDNLSDFDYDARGLELRRIDGKNTPEARIVETVWDSNFRVPTERRTCATNATNTCAPTATAPNLLSKTIMSYNARGQLLSSTQIDPALSSNTRTTTTTYCDAVNITLPNNCPQIGLVKSIDGPRTDVVDVTNYSYYTDNTADHRKGDTWKVTNATNQVVEYLAYDGAGRALKIKDPNGVETWMTYHPRGWLLTRTVKGATVADDATTTMAYTPFGAIERVTQPDGAFLQYGYDQAQRMTGISDNAGNSITYLLDAAGNRVKESTTDGAAVVKRLMARQYDQLSRMKASIRAPFAAQANLDDPSVKKTSMTFDGNGNTELTTDPLGTVGDNDYDALNRLIKTLQAVGGIAAKVEYSYDALDRLTSAKDPNLLNTVYGYDGLSNLKTLTSPDTGITAYTYDAAGNRKSQIDARGVKSEMTYDVLNRLSKIEYTPAGTSLINAGKTVQFYYDQSDRYTDCPGSFRYGRMTSFTDESGSTTLCYDRRGNVTKKTQVNDGIPIALTMTYSKADRLSGLTYPNGTTVAYGRDSQGRIASVSINGTAFITGVSYLPFGPVNVITFANGKTLTKTYDQNYDIDAIVSTATGGLNLDYSLNEVGNITGVVQSGTQFNLIYDKLYRLTDVKDQNSALIEGFAYDATGNRLSKKLGTAPLVAYNYAPATHKLTNAGDGVRNFDANGNTLNTPQNSSLSYDERNRLVTTVQASSCVKKPCLPPNSVQAVYNARGERVVRQLNTQTNSQFRTMMFDEGGKLLVDGVDTAIVYIDSIPVARVNSGVINPIEADHLGSPRVLQNAAGSSAVWTWNLLSNSATGSNAFGEQAPTGTLTDFNLRFPGQYSDGNGLSYNYFRDYEAGTGRYVESDPIGLNGGLSTYGYVDQTPTMGVDFTGLSREKIREIFYSLSESDSYLLKTGRFLKRSRTMLSHLVVKAEVQNCYLASITQNPKEDQFKIYSEYLKIGSHNSQKITAITNIATTYNYISYDVPGCLKCSITDETFEPKNSSSDQTFPDPPGVGP